MKKRLLTALFLLSAIVGMAQSWTAISSDQPAEIKTTLISSSESKITVHVQVPGFNAMEVATPQGAAQVITLPKAVSTAEAGEPNLPMIAIPAIIGDQQHYAIRVVDSRHTDFNLEVAPSKGFFSRQIDPDDVPYTYGEAYAHDAFFPAEQVGLYEPYILRDFRGQNMVVYPFAYNPVSKTLRVYYDLTVELYSDGGQGQNTLNRKSNTLRMDPEFKAMYEDRFINAQAGMNRYAPVDEEGSLLIICHDAFMSAMEPFINWKKQIGIPTTMVGTSVAGTTSDVIKNYIQQQYNNDNSIAHILLVGDANHIQGYYAANGYYSGRSDNWFGQLVGNDFYNDVIVGRFSAENLDHVTTQVNKVINYERDLNASDTWLDKATGVATTAGNGGHFGEDDWQHIDNIRTDLIGYGYEEVYRDYQSGGGAHSTAAQLSQHINEGLSMINYCNHGSEISWGVFNYSNSHVNALTNVNKLPVVWSVACLNGKYDYYQPCFAEAWLRATNNDVNQPTGAIGGMFSYISQPWVPPMYGQDEMVDVLVESYENNIKRTLGGVSFDGNMKIIDQYGTSNTSGMGTYMCWILFGDPTLTMRTAIPTAMTIDHAPVIPMGMTEYEITATNAEGARATLTFNGEILGSAVINNGSATIGFEVPEELGEATLTVFGYNKTTYIATVPVVSGGEEGPVEVQVTANPTIIARNTSTTLNAQATGGNWYFNYHWTPEESLSQSNIKSPTATPTTTTTYTCTVNSGTHSGVDSCTVIVVCPPENLTATAVGSDIQLTWDAAEYADSYKVYRNSVLIAQELTGTSYTDSNLNPGSYSYRVSSTYQDVSSPKSGPAAATILAPLSVSATASPSVIAQGATTTLTANITGGDDATCIWTPAETLSNPNAATTTASPTETTTYTVNVTRGEETASAETTVQVVTSPSELTATLVTDNSAQLQWEPAVLVDSYRIYRDLTLVASNVSDTQYTIEDLTNGTHCFTVSAVYQGVESPKTEEACLEVDACIPPEALEANYFWENNQFGTLLVWGKDQSTNMSLVRFNIYRGTDPDNMEKIASQVNVPFTYHYEYRDRDVLPGEYYYMIGANYGEDQECYTNPVQVTVTSLDESQQSLCILPNPTHGNVTITTSGEGELRIVNTFGQTLLHTAVEQEALQLDLAPFGKGLYMVIVRSGQGVTTKKIIVE